MICALTVVQIAVVPANWRRAVLVIFLQSVCATGRNANRELPRFGLNTIPLPTGIVPAVQPQPKISPPAFLALPVCLTLA